MGTSRRLLAVLAVAAGSLGPGAATADAWSSSWWHLPSGNIRCRYYPDIGGARVIACTTLNDRFWIAMRPGAKPWHGYGWSGWSPFYAGPTLRYGDTWTVRRTFRCWSARTGVTCKSLVRRHGFFLSRTSYRAW